MQKKLIEVDGRKIEVREFLVSQIEEIFADPQVGIDIITDALIGKPQGMKKLLMQCTDLGEEEISGLGFGAFTRLTEAMQEVNADFFVIYQKRMARLEQIMSARGSSAIPAPSAGLSPKGTPAP